MKLKLNYRKNKGSYTKYNLKNKNQKNEKSNIKYSFTVLMELWQ